MTEYKDILIKVRGERIGAGEWRIKAGRHEIYLSKNVEKYPNPIQCLLAALAGCIQSVGELVAIEMGFVIEDLKVEVEGVFNPAGIYGQGNHRAGLKEIRARIKIKSNCQDVEKLKEWLKKVEGRCPVGDNLANPTSFVIEFEKS